MSNLVFPTLAGLKIDIERGMPYRTTIQEARNGKEYRVVRWTAPRDKYRLNFSPLRSASWGAAYTEFQQLVGFYARHAGAWDSFLFTDPEDNAVASLTGLPYLGHPFGIGDGATVAFQLQRSIAAVIPPIPQSFTATPSASGGTLATGTYYYAVAACMADGTESIAPNTSVSVTGPTGSVALACAAVTGAIFYKWYRSTNGWASGVYFLTGSPSYTDTGTAGTAGLPHPWSLAYYPAVGDGYEPVFDPGGIAFTPSNSPSIYVNGVLKTPPADYSISATGLVTFTAPPAATLLLTWTGSYYRRVRFEQDSLDLKRVVNGIWEGSVSLYSVIP